MDFALDAEATAVADVAAEVFSRHEPQWDATFARTGEAGFDTELWAAMHAAGLTTLALPDALGGDELGVAAMGPLLRRMGESAAVVPALGSVAALLSLAGSQALPYWATPLAEGRWLAVAIGEVGDPLGETPATTLRDGTLNGAKTGVLHAAGAAGILVTTDQGVVAVPVDAPGVHLVATPTSSGWGEYTVEFCDVAVGAQGMLDVDNASLRDHYRITLCAFADGLVSGAAALTATHVSTRHQFGKPIALFQAVGQQLADIYVIARAMHLATTASIWRYSEGLDARKDLAIATYWLASELPATVRTMTHLHGGVGVDITYPLHRYFSIIKDLARLVGGPSARLDELAAVDAREDADVD